MEAAIAAAYDQREQNPEDRAHLGAILVKRKQLVWATNKMDKTHPESRGWENGVLIAKGIHAEQMVLIRGRKFTDGASIYVARITKNDDLATSRPCPSCRILIEEAGVKKVHYSIGPYEWGEWMV